MMGGQCSKNDDTNSPQPQSQTQSQSRSSLTPPLPPLEISKNTVFTTHLSSYETACRSDPGLRSFDAVVQERTERVLGTLSTGIEVRSLSFNSLKEVTDCLLEMNQEVVKVILENKKDIWGNKDMFSLVDQYFDNSIQTLEFCTALSSCLKRTVGNQLILRAAISHFEEALGQGGGPGDDVSSFDKTLSELAKFKAAGDPFTNEFFAIFQSVLTKQYVLLEKLLGQKRDIDKKLKSLKTWRRVSNVIFVTVFVTVLICSVVAAAIAAPPVVTALLGALAVPVGSVGKWCSSLWARYASAVRGQREIISSMQVGTVITLKDLENIRVLINKLEIEIQSLIHDAEFALAEDGSVKIVMEEIKKKLEAFTETTESLNQQNNKCIQDITVARRVIVQRIIKPHDEELLSSMMV